MEQPRLLAQQLLLVRLEQLHVALLGERLLRVAVQVGGHASSLGGQHLLHLRAQHDEDNGGTQTKKRVSGCTIS